jgi:RES domain-containing protein
VAEITAWRMTHRRWADSAFSGEGARLAGGRFNSVGVPVVYTSATRSLATLEILVQVDDRGRLADHVVIPATFDGGLVEIADARDLPAGWDNVPDTEVATAFGDAWQRGRRSVILRVPSVIVPGEHNYLINPEHPEVVGVSIGRAEAVRMDPRLGRGATVDGGR